MSVSQWLLTNDLTKVVDLARRCSFIEHLSDKRNESVLADIVVRKDARECVICQVEMSIGMKVTRMPCQVRARKRDVT